MIDPPQSEPSERVDQPGKTRTWWHPLLARLLDFSLSSAFTVMDEVLVGKMPLRVDILLVRREGGQLSETGRRDLSALVPLLNRFTLIEFKGPTDVLERGDFAQLAGCSFLWHSQQSDPIPCDDVSLVVLSPTVTGPLRDELRLLNCEAVEHEPGIFRVTGLPFVAWLVETDVMAERGQPVLSLVSRVFLKERGRIIEELNRSGHGPLLHYMLQQVNQFRYQGEDFAMQHGYSDNMAEVEEELLTQILRNLPIERRLRGVPPEARVQGLSPEELVAAMSDEERSQVRELLERKENQDR